MLKKQINVNCFDFQAFELNQRKPPLILIVSLSKTFHRWSMAKKITIINGHPDSNDSRLCCALAQSYIDGANEAGHETKTIRIANLSFPLITDPADYKKGEAPGDIKEAQNAIAWADHIVIVYPLWLGTMPAMLKAFFEQMARPGFAFTETKGGFPKGALGGRSARIVITMGMPTFAYRWYFFAHGLKVLERNILKFCGISPVRNTLFGLVEVVKDPVRKGWLEKMRKLGAQGK